jgi:hypothetical protein|tara:strand:+ start:422 stop:619 length:198 start_codon:yes stop_codon:yes gene_type:complete
MPRPNKILEPTKTYNLLMTVSQYDKLSVYSHDMTRRSLEQVSVADLIRDAIEVYLEVLEGENEED